MNDILVFNIARLAVKSLLNAAAAWPKPGLVTPLEGAGGTDFQSVVDGALALLPCFLNCASIGFETEELKPEDTMSLLRPAGLQGEREVEWAVRGSLSFRGSIFFLGLLSAAAGRLFAQKRNLTPMALALSASACVRGCMEQELHSLDPRSAGQSAGRRVWLLYGVEGARGEVERGFPLTLRAVDLMKKLEDEHSGFLSARELAAQAFLSILIDNADSALAEASGLEGMLRAQGAARDAFKAGGVLTTDGRAAVEELDKSFRGAGACPRGAMVVLSAALFIRELEGLCPTRTGRAE